MRSLKLSMLVATVILVVGLFLSGCDQFTLGAGAGLAGAQTFNQWKENLENKKTELQEQYAVLQAELDAAIDPNEVKLAATKLRAVQEQQLVNESALLTIKAVLEKPESGDSNETKNNYIAELIAGGFALLTGYQTLAKNKLNLKYISAKTGQAKLAQVNPEAEKQLYEFIGQERTAQGL